MQPVLDPHSLGLLGADALAPDAGVIVAVAVAVAEPLVLATLEYIGPHEFPNTVAATPVNVMRISVDREYVGQSLVRLVVGQPLALDDDIRLCPVVPDCDRML